MILFDLSFLIYLIDWQPLNFDFALKMTLDHLLYFEDFGLSFFKASLEIKVFVNLDFALYYCLIMFQRST